MTAKMPAANIATAKIWRGMRFPLTLTACLAFGYYVPPLIETQYQRINPPPAYETGDYAAYFTVSGVEAVMYSDSDCPWCRRAREYLRAAGVAFDERFVDLSAQAAKEYAGLDAPAVPVILIGDRKIVGFDREAIRDALTHARMRGADSAAMRP